LSARPSHAARIETSPRLRALLTALLKAGDRGLTTREIFDRTGSMAVHSDAHELRQNGYRIGCRSDGKTAGGRRVFRYRIEVAKAPESPVLSTGQGGCS
jgi:hypothetical protein